MKKVFAPFTKVLKEKKCLYCSKKFSVPWHFREQKYCSHKCWEDFAIGKNCPNWKGGKHIYSHHGNEYYIVQVDRKSIKEHRHVMEKFLKRKLLKDEIIHHKDGNGLNNSIENLEIVSASDHSRLHKKRKCKIPDFVCKCGNKIYFAKLMCSTCYARENARKRYGYKKRSGKVSKLYA